MGKGIQHHYEVLERNAEELVIDHATGLMWQRGGSQERLNFAEGQGYIELLNREKFAGYTDWRLPTLEEAMSLMEPKKNEHGLYIDPVFDKSQGWIWTADEKSAGGAWVVGFSIGFCYHIYVHTVTTVRAVRSGQS